MTEETLVSIMDKALQQLGHKIGTEEDMMKVLGGMAKAIYNKGIEDAVNATKIMTIEGEYPTPDSDGEYYISGQDGAAAYIGEYPSCGTHYLKINKEEVLKLKI